MPAAQSVSAEGTVSRSKQPVGATKSGPIIFTWVHALPLILLLSMLMLMSRIICYIYMPCRLDSASSGEKLQWKGGKEPAGATEWARHFYVSAYTFLPTIIHAYVLHYMLYYIICHAGWILALQKRREEELWREQSRRRNDQNLSVSVHVNPYLSWH